MKWIQKMLDHLGGEMCSVVRWILFITTGYLWICALLAPVSEYCYVGKWRFYQLWQKFVFSIGCALGGYGIFRLGEGLRTTKEKTARIRVAA